MDLSRIKNQYSIMRHGQSRGNVEGIIVSNPENGVPGFGLTQKGRAQAARAVKNFQGLDMDTLIVSSDFKRARQTAEIAAQYLKTTQGVILSPLLRERFFGDWELTPDKNYPGIWEEDGQRLALPTHNVESVESVLNRVLACISEIENRHRDKTILLVSHGDTLQIFLTFLKGRDPHRHREIDHLEVAQIRQAIG